MAADRGTGAGAIPGFDHGAVVRQFDPMTRRMRGSSTAFVLASFGAGAVVIRGEVPDAEYRFAASMFPAHVDMPDAGQGVPIAPRWLVTAAHAASWLRSAGAVIVAGSSRAARRVVIPPGYRPPPQEMVEPAPQDR
jgi:hypothetical protein